ncbi:DUF4179 domain-containing protein [Paenibacillus sp. Marseille-Q4541]|uniref:DUF4179 domain-containing protein n=1 Tax=Paenibacillus sp. Marseille-Q4541 TaxID=2831522 RepID=UPI001BA9D674|nr:DUF4179 domain-containing protein [Paenibacillus sp. Marseille-Q4541]
MSQYFEKEEHIPQPEYEKMWTAIEQEVFKRKAIIGHAKAKAGFRRRMKMVPVSIVFSCFLLVAIPAFASVALNWDMVGGRSITNALNNGIGQRYDLKTTNAGITVNLNGVVTDGEHMKMLISLDSVIDPERYNDVDFEQVVMTNKSGMKEEANGTLNYDPISDQLLGVFQTDDTLKDRKKAYSLEIQNLVFYRNKDIPLKSDLLAGSSIDTEINQYPSIHIESVRQDNNQTVVRYKVAASPSNSGDGNPHLVMKTGNNEFEAVPTILPSDSSELLIEQVFNMTEQDWKAADPHFSYMEEAERINGAWKFDFRADGKKASEAIYSKELQLGPEIQNTTGITLDKLIVTPLNIEILITDKGSLTSGDVHYKSAELVIGNHTVSGVQTIKGNDPENYQHLYQFESPEWYNNWSDVSMKLILKDAVIEKRDTSKNWITLHRPSEEKQFTELNVDGYPIQFTYYTDGNELIVESKSDSPGFKGISQTTMRVNGTEVVPEVMPKGMVSTGVNIDHYKNIDLDGELQLNPGIYKYSDPSRDIEINLK